MGRQQKINNFSTSETAEREKKRIKSSATMRLVRVTVAALAVVVCVAKNPIFKMANKPAYKMANKPVFKPLARGRRAKARRLENMDERYHADQGEDGNYRDGGDDNEYGGDDAERYEEDDRSYG